MDIPNVTRNVTVDLKNGNDSVLLKTDGGGFARDVTLKMGNGNDVVKMGNENGVATRRT